MRGESMMLLRSPRPMRGRGFAGNTLLVLGALALSTPVVLAQGTFSIDYQGPPIGAPDGCTGVPLTEGDILYVIGGTPAPGPLPPPCIFITAGPGGLALPLYPGAVGHPPGVPGAVEVDALSYGLERPLQPVAPNIYNWYFSVDEFAVGIGLTPPPNVFSEGAAAAAEASADVFVDAGVGPGPAPCGIVGPGNTDVIDGDGIPPFGGFGVGLMEPNPPFPGLPDFGSNLDALDVDTPNLGPPIYPVYFSLDSGFFDAVEGVPNSASALINGLGVGGDVLMVPGPGAIPMIFAPAPMLGLDLIGGPDSDDLDALVLWENGSGVYEPSMAPYDWLGGGTDMLFFSVRPGSAVIGAPDSMCGMPIEPGDILGPPVAAGGFPAIWIPAEALGLGTLRGGWLNQDDLNALDVYCTIPADINGDGVVDLTDLGILLLNFGTGGPGDINGDGIVDLTDLGILLLSFGAKC